MLLSGCVADQSGSTARLEEDQAPSAIEPTDFPEEVYWGNFHLHTNLSFDAYTFGTTAFTPDQAYRFARGEEVTSVSGLKAKLSKPLDFLMVSDHAEFLGFMVGANEDDPLLAGNRLAARWSRYLSTNQTGKVLGEFIALTSGQSSQVDAIPQPFSKSVWYNIASTADRFNEPGKFTAFAGYEWTSIVSGDNLHRVVVFKDGKDNVTKFLPFSSLDSNDPEDLWAYLARYRKETGGEVLAIPHNGNLSEGSMFDDETLSGKPFDRAYLEARKRWEPVVEVTQVKGDGETHPALSPEDEFADFENWDKGDIAGNPRSFEKKSLIEQLQGEYARGALLKGLRYQADKGVNPYQFGMIGDSDSHNGLPTARENNFFGKFADSEPSATRIESSMGGSLWSNKLLTASGYTAVWARANTREEIFKAVQRREVYASTGPRVRLRFFGGWNFSKSAMDGGNYVATGYGQGVPMGGVLTQTGAGHAGPPRFMIVALKDPDSANLDRIQIVKGWRDASGRLHERLFDVALSDNRKVNPKTGKAPPVGSTVDIAKASYKNSIGAVELRSFWQDPEFDAAQQAFYYVRVLEIPTPRWTTYDAVRYGKKIPDGVPAIIQERAYSSPIWYVPTP